MGLLYFNQNAITLLTQWLLLYHAASTYSPCRKNRVSLGCFGGQSRVVTQMGGTLQVQSMPGHGNRFWFTVALMEAPAPLQSPAPRQQIIGLQGPAPTILVVDDTWENRRLLVDLLTGVGCTVWEAADGANALERLAQQPPSALIVDLVMPGMDGYTFIRQVRAQAALATLPIIATSASVAVHDHQRSLDAGSNAFLPKPIMLEALLATLQRRLAIEWIFAPTPTLPDAPLQRVVRHAPIDLTFTEDHNTTDAALFCNR